MFDDDDELEQEQESHISNNVNIGPDSDEAEDINAQDEDVISKSAVKLEVVEAFPNPEEKERERAALEKAMQDFLERGGVVQSLEPTE